MSKETLRIGVVGMGKMGLLHASILNLLPGVQLAAVCEKSGITRKLLKKIFSGIPLVDDVNKFADLDLDVVYVTTPISTHYNVAKTVCKERFAKHLFIEKPLTSNYSESKELSELMNQSGGANMVGYLRRFMVTFRKAKDLLSQNAIGEPVSFTLNAFSSDFYGMHDNPKISIARGGVLRDLGSYAIDLATWFFGDMKVISAATESLTGAGAEDAVHFTATRDLDALQGDFAVSWCVDGYRMPEVIFTIKGSKGSIEANDDRVSLNLNDGKATTWYRHNLNDDVQFWLGGPEYYRENAYFVKSIRDNLVAEPSFETASKVDYLIETIQKESRNK